MNSLTSELVMHQEILDEMNNSDGIWTALEPLNC
jgi:hypothetical protein